jgi:hypothetical protein
MRVVYNGERSDFIWTADPLISENPFNTEIFWLIALFAERIFDYSGEWDDEIANLVAEKLDEGIAEALRWPDLWHALHGPRTNGVSPHFDDENAHWKSSLVPSAFRVPTGAATSLDSEFAKPMAMAVSHRYIDSWLMNCITAEHGSFPYNTPISPEDLARSFGQQLPNPASIQADDPAAEPPPFDPFMNVGQTRCPDPPSPPPPQTVYEAGMVRSEPRISLPTTEEADYVADFEIDYWLRISAIRTWEIPVFSSSGYDCIPPGGLDLIDPGVLPFDPQDIFSRLDRDIFDFARVNFDQFATSFTNNLAVGGQMQSFSGGGSIPIPGGPTPGIPTPGTDVPGLPDQQTGHCAIECTWSFEPERRNIITPLQVHGRIRGKLMLDFDPDFYGEESKGILQGPIPGIRLSVVHEPASDRPGSAALEGEILGVMTDSVFTSVPEDQIRNACLERFMANAHDLLDGLVFVDSPRLKMPLVPKNRAIERLPLDTIVAVFEWARSLIVLQHPSDDGNPTYNIDGNMVYFSVELVEGVTAFVDGNDSD